jgi:hypothetical protein
MTHTLRELAGRNGQIMARLDPAPGRSDLSAAHRAAAMFNGWNTWERISGEPVRLTDEVYNAAIDCARKHTAHKAANMRKLIDGVRQKRGKK